MCLAYLLVLRQGYFSGRSPQGLSCLLGCLPFTFLFKIVFSALLIGLCSELLQCKFLASRALQTWKEAGIAHYFSENDLIHEIIRQNIGSKLMDIVHILLFFFLVWFVVVSIKCWSVVPGINPYHIMLHVSTKTFSISRKNIYVTPEYFLNIRIFCVWFYM